MAVMTVAEKQKQNAVKYRKRFALLRENSPERAKEEAVRELIKMGLLDKDGKKKETIVSWE